MTGEGDLVLVHMDGKPTFFARVESIEADFKPGWHHIKMLVLQVPLVVITWILRDAYIDGEEFTMGGRPVRLEKVVSPEETEKPEEKEISPEGTNVVEAPPETGEKGKIISFKDRRKKD